jgi:uncharacterized protein
MGLATLPAITIATLTIRECSARYICLFYVLLLCYFLLLPLPGQLGLEFGSSYNWVGKFASFVGAVVFTVFGPLTADEVGATLRQRPASLLPALLFVLFFLWLSDSPEHAADSETLLFQATIPGLDEELIFRGILLAVLARALPQPREGIRRLFNWNVVITCLAFGLGHGVRVSQGVTEFRLEYFVSTFIAGYLFTGLRLYTGSLVLPVIFHNALNTIGVGGLIWLSDLLYQR